MKKTFLDLPIAPQREREKQSAFLLSLSLFVCGALTISAHAQNEDSFLNAVRSAEASAHYSATQVTRRRGEREVAKIYRNGQKRRLEWLEPSIKCGDILLDDGQSVWLYHSADKTAIQTRAARRGAGFLSQGWQVGPPQNQNGRTVRILTREGGRQLTVDNASKLIVGTKGSAGGSTTLQDLQIGTPSDSKFVFTRPAGVKVIPINGRLFGDLNAARRHSSWFQAPTQLPDGYSFESAVVGENEVWLRYFNGKKRFSIFQQKTQDGDMLPPKPVDGGKFWRRNGIRFLASDAPDSIVQQLSNP